MPRTRLASRFTARLRLLVPVLTACLIALAVAGPSAARADELIHVEIRLAAATTLSDLVAAGLDIELALPDLGRVQGWIDPARLAELHALVGVGSVTTPNYALFAAGSVLSEGDEALGAAAARERFGVDGSGVRVAVISDGIVGIEQSQERGDAPELVEAMAFGAGRLDRGAEGTAMIELVHDLAPGASISFGAVTTDADMIAAVRFFAQRVDVIVDDVGFLYPDESAERGLTQHGGGAGESRLAAARLCHGRRQLGAHALVRRFHGRGRRRAAWPARSRPGSRLVARRSD